MIDRQDKLRHIRVAHHTYVRWEKSQQVPEAHGLSSQAEPSTSGARVFPHATPSSSSRRRRDSPSDALLPSSSRRRQVSPVPPHTVDVVDLVPPHTIDVADPVPPPTTDDVDRVPPPKGEVVARAELEEFGGVQVDLSLLPLYPDHTSIHI